ncbi:MAG TPA: LUD domain-containing protein [Planctomicrobium sp.]|nr:LUD domain-containing protein [Planctomicrobium sp.]
MSSRSQILRSVRQFLPQATELPDHNGNWIQYDDLAAQFAGVLEFVGGECHVINSTADILPHLKEEAAPGKVVVSNVDGVPGTLDLKQISDPHDLAGVDLAVFWGDLAVAENAGIWVNNKNIPHRAIYFITQHLVLVVRLKDLVPHLHAAYERIDVTASSLGCFISGPSKTADIEQSLVKGAHGARTLKVFLVRE